MSYLPCELHCHTVHSDGAFQVRELLSVAKENHLVMIALTDHNTLSGHDELDNNLLPAIRGIEWTTYFGHMLVLGANGFVDWRDATPDNIDEKIAEVKALGGIVGIAHPFQIGSPVCTGGRWEFNVSDWNAPDYMEIWHGDMSRINYENTRAPELWTSLLDKGYRIAATYGRDWHGIENNGHYGCTYIDFDDEINEENALKAIKEGRTVVSTGAKFFFNIQAKDKIYKIGSEVEAGKYIFNFFIDLHSREKDAGNESIKYTAIRIITNGGKIALEKSCSDRLTELELEAGNWYRAELWGTVDGELLPLAITSPIYCKQ